MDRRSDEITLPSSADQGPANVAPTDLSAHLGLIGFVINHLRLAYPWLTQDEWNEVNQELFIVLHRAQQNFTPGPTKWSTYAIASLFRGSGRIVRRIRRRSRWEKSREVPFSCVSEMLVRGRHWMLAQDDTILLDLIEYPAAYDEALTHLKRLDPRGRFVLLARCGLNGPERMLTELGELIGVGKERARQLAERAAFDVRQMFAGRYAGRRLASMKTSVPDNPDDADEQPGIVGSEANLSQCHPKGNRPVSKKKPTKKSDTKKKSSSSSGSSHDNTYQPTYVPDTSPPPPPTYDFGSSGSSDTGSSGAGDWSGGSADAGSF